MVIRLFLRVRFPSAALQKKEAQALRNQGLRFFYVINKYDFVLLLISKLIVLYYPHGALAQLGARNIRIVKATGSTPVCSTHGSIAQPG